MEPHGYLKFIVDPNGEKGFLVEYQGNNYKLQEHFTNFADQNLDNVIDLSEVYEKNPNVTDCLVLATFHYQLFSSFNGETTEWNEDIQVVDVMVVCKNYKERWRRNLTDLLQVYDGEIPNPCDENHLTIIDDISIWEEFYEEKFESRNDY